MSQLRYWAGFFIILSALNADDAAADEIHEASATAMSGIALGFHTHFTYGKNGAVGDDYSNIATFIVKTGIKPAMIQGFYSWKNADGTDRVFPKEFADYVVARGAVPVITWQPGQADQNNQVERRQPDWTCAQLASGRYDAYIRAWAAAAKAYTHVVYVRLMHEFINAPYPYSYTWDHENNSPKNYIAAFHHIVGIFHEIRATNVQFIWCYGCGSRNPSPVDWFPGDDYVDWLGLDGYNYGFGTQMASKLSWRSFDEIYRWPYDTLAAVSKRPFMICEIACAEFVDKKGSKNIVDKAKKPDWINDAFLEVIPRKMPRIKAIILFNSVGHSYPTYVVDSSPESLTMFQRVFKNPGYQAKLPEQPLQFE